MSGRKRGRGQEWEREMMERETLVGEKEIGIGQRERERERGMGERERERGYRCGIKRERQGIILLPSQLPFSSQDVISYKLYIIYHNDSGEKQGNFRIFL